MQLVHLTNDPTPAPFPPGVLSLTEYERSKKFVSWTADRDGNWFVAKSRPHLVGRLLIGNHLFSAPPSIDSSLFVDLLLYSAGLKPLDRERLGGAIVNPARDHDAFLRILAHVMSIVAEKLLRSGLTKIYQERTERTMVVRGRIKWGASLARPPQDGLVCDYFQMEMDNDLNRLVLAGLEAASRLSPNAQLSSLIFAWRTLCTRKPVTASQFDRAQKLLTRRTESYRAALTLAKILNFGAAVEDAFSIGNVDLPEMRFDLAVLFEKAVTRLLGEYFAGTQLQTHSQQRDELAICFPDRSMYQVIKPDIRVVRGHQVLAVFDAKFKSRYAHGENVSEADLYQTFLYASRATSPQFPLVCAGILVPRLVHDEVSPRFARHIVMPRAHDDLHLRVIPIEIEATMEVLRRGGSARQAIAASPEWHQACLAIEAAA